LKPPLKLSAPGCRLNPCSRKLPRFVSKASWPNDSCLRHQPDELAVCERDCAQQGAGARGHGGQRHFNHFAPSDSGFAPPISMTRPTSARSNSPRHAIHPVTAPDHWPDDFSTGTPCRHPRRRAGQSLA